jgi:enamine deaminase RidA (YjgF/YER057c/UK114 family)
VECSSLIIYVYQAAVDLIANDLRRNFNSFDIDVVWMVAINYHNESFATTKIKLIMDRYLINSGSTFEEEIGYSRAVVDGDWIFVSGTTGFDYSTMTISDDIAEQTEQCLKNIGHALLQANSGLGDIVRVMYIVPKAEEFSKCWPVLKKYLGNIKPAATMIAAGLADVKMKIEIQVTALRKNATHDSL